MLIFSVVAMVTLILVLRITWYVLDVRRRGWSRREFSLVVVVILKCCCRGKGWGKACCGVRLILVSFLLEVALLKAMGCCSSCSVFQNSLLFVVCPWKSCCVYSE